MTGRKCAQAECKDLADDDSNYCGIHRPGKSTSWQGVTIAGSVKSDDGLKTIPKGGSARSDRID